MKNLGTKAAIAMAIFAALFAIRQLSYGAERQGLEVVRCCINGLCNGEECSKSACLNLTFDDCEEVEMTCFDCMYYYVYLCEPKDVTFCYLPDGSKYLRGEAK